MGLDGLGASAGRVRSEATSERLLVIAVIGVLAGASNLTFFTLRFFLFFFFPLLSTAGRIKSRSSFFFAALISLGAGGLGWSFCEERNDEWEVVS
jgi:hypothetical protein